MPVPTACTSVHAPTGNKSDSPSHMCMPGDLVVAPNVRKGQKAHVEILQSAQRGMCLLAQPDTWLGVSYSKHQPKAVH